MPHCSGSLTPPWWSRRNSRVTSRSCSFVSLRRLGTASFASSPANRGSSAETADLLAMEALVFAPGSLPAGAGVTSGVYTSSIRFSFWER